MELQETVVLQDEFKEIEIQQLPGQIISDDDQNDRNNDDDCDDIGNHSSDDDDDDFDLQKFRNQHNCNSLQRSSHNLISKSRKYNQQNNVKLWMMAFLVEAKKNGTES
eukprot:TRINITY_DN15156_c0_g1_i1.p1 TRINITY_DN15156_c0_g1~~TRINITY_DN15156_c0_g1_i1.p1  ORF type:complete len:108 (-),score=24.22 TRINITY_DN15156_c0_g1_i1:14-337(-)